MHTYEEIASIEALIKLSFNELIQYDYEIIGMGNHIKTENHVSCSVEIENRKLHEVCINHRFAHYLENNLKSIPNYSAYFVDMEFNRLNSNSKELNGKIIRPDIIIHARMNDKIKPQNLLAIEAKKDLITSHDTAKVKGLIKNSKYKFKYGLTVSYCRRELKLYYIESSNKVEQRNIYPQ